jgi:tRNA threonylcarbamoyladenosine biosynthesis protein TsaE
MRKPKKIISYSADETKQQGLLLGKSLSANSIVALFGDLGAGKTTFIKGLVEGIAGIDPKHVNSPTFTYLHLYTGTHTVYHFDLYRIKTSNDFYALGFDEYFTAGGICCLEWPERLGDKLPKEAIMVTLSYEGENTRHIEIGHPA